MPERYEAAAEEWLNGLDENRLRDALGEIGKLKADARRAAMANPIAAFERAGVLRPPKGVTIKILRQTPRNLPDFPKLKEFDDLFRVPRIKFFCFQICYWVPWIVGGHIIGFRRVCRLICRRI